jgi:hypothetical protein
MARLFIYLNNILLPTRLGMSVHEYGSAHVVRDRWALGFWYIFISIAVGLFGRFSIAILILELLEIMDFWTW